MNKINYILSESIPSFKRGLGRFFLFLLITTSLNIFAQTPSYQIALLKYNGGGDWYANLETSLPNLIHFCNTNLKTNINPEQAIVDIGSQEIFNYPYVHLTGHGNVIFNDFSVNVEGMIKYLNKEIAKLS